MVPPNEFSLPKYDNFLQDKGGLSSQGSPGRRRGDSGFFNNDFMIRPPGFEAAGPADPFPNMVPEIPPNYNEMRSFEPPPYGQPTFGSFPPK